VVIRIRIDDCEEDHYFVDGFGDEEEEEEDVKCCDIIGVSNVHYDSVPGVSRHLKFDIQCDGNWPEFGGLCLDGSVFVGADPTIIHWTDVQCCQDPDHREIMNCI